MKVRPKFYILGSLKKGECMKNENNFINVDNNKGMNKKNRKSVCNLGEAIQIKRSNLPIYKAGTNLKSRKMPFEKNDSSTRIILKLNFKTNSLDVTNLFFHKNKTKKTIKIGVKND